MHLIVYIKTPDSKRYEALSKISNFTIAPNLMYAALFPVEKLDRLKKYLNQFDFAKFQIRDSTTRKKILFEK